MAKRYVLSTRSPIPGNCNSLTKSGRYCANRIAVSDHCAAGHPVVHGAGTPEGVGRIVDALPVIEGPGEAPLTERLDKFVERLRVAEDALYSQAEGRSDVDPSDKGKTLLVAECVRAVRDTSLNSIEDLVLFQSWLEERRRWNQERADASPLHQAECEGAAEGLDYVSALLDEMDLVVEAVDEEADSPGSSP